MLVKRGRARIVAEEGEGVGGGIPHPWCGKILKSRTSEIWIFSYSLPSVP